MDNNTTENKEENLSLREKGTIILIIFFHIRDPYRNNALWH